MKTKFFTLFFIATLFTVGCKKDKSVDDLKVVDPKKAAESKVNVVLDMVVPEDDIFQVFYNEDGTSACSEERSVKVAVKGSAASQKIRFDLSEDLAINYLRVDLGENKSQGQMKMNGFAVQYFDKKFETKGNQFFQYYSPTPELIVDFPNSTITPKNTGKTYDPIFYPLETLRPELEKILK